MSWPRQRSGRFRFAFTLPAFAMLGLAWAAHAAPPPVTPIPPGRAMLPALRPPCLRPSGVGQLALSSDATACAFDALRDAMERDVSNLLKPSGRAVAEAAARAAALLRQTGQPLDAPQLVLVVDRNPAVQRLMLMLARPGNVQEWRLVGAAHVSTGQAGRKDYYITPVGVFAHTDAILDFRAAGTRNEHHVRGLGLAGMRVWDFGWQWALKGWHTDGAGGNIRLQMHATDPDLLERRLGRPASEGCVRVSSTMNRFLDRYGVLDADYERVAATDIRYGSLLSPQRTPTPLAGRLLIVIDTSRPAGDPPTAASRPADWPPPPDLASPPPDTALPPDAT